MAGVKPGHATSTRDLMDARLAEILTEPIDWPYPDDVTLVPADDPDAAETIAEAARAGKTVVLFFPDGEETILTPSKPGD